MPRKAAQSKCLPASLSSVFLLLTNTVLLVLILCNDEAAAAVEGISLHGIKNEGYLEKTTILNPTIAKTVDGSVVSDAGRKQEWIVSSTRDDIGDEDNHFGRFHKENNSIEANQAEEDRELLREEVPPPARKRIRKTPKRYNRGRGKRGEQGAASQMELTQCLQKALEETKLREFGKPKKTNDALIIQQQQYQLYDEHVTLVGTNMELSSGRRHHNSEEIQRKINSCYGGTVLENANQLERDRRARIEARDQRIKAREKRAQVQVNEEQRQTGNVNGNPNTPLNCVGPL